MNRFYGPVGYADSVETPLGSGVWRDRVLEFPYFGDVVRNIRRLQDGDSVNSDITSGNSISIVADERAFEHFHAIRYVRWAGAYWTVTSVEVKSPRLILALGGVYNGSKA